MDQNNLLKINSFNNKHESDYTCNNDLQQLPIPIPIQYNEYNDNFSLMNNNTMPYTLNNYEQPLVHNNDSSYCTSYESQNIHHNVNDVNGRNSEQNPSQYTSLPQVN